jgi:hypothetical protein
LAIIRQFSTSSTVIRNARGTWDSTTYTINHLHPVAKMSAEYQAAVVATVKSGDAPNIHAAAASTTRIEEAEPAIHNDRAGTNPTTAQKRARYLADPCRLPSTALMQERRTAIY